ncbi:transposase [Desulforhopalus vacuolatus]|uniref:transposase n=1 Tax=Desulforhopalus vacuolatus TaxID=40414 RepID=UPI001963FDB5|nr:transposase [Desulforhopalus vacuolatus]
MQTNIKDLIDDSLYDTVRELRWPEGRFCPFCASKRVISIRTGFDKNENSRQRYQSEECSKRFDDLTGTIFSGYHQSLKVWILCLLFLL